MNANMKIIKHHSAGDALIAALTIKEQEYDCILVRDFWSYESDNWKLISPSGKCLSIWSHHRELRCDGNESQDVKLFHSVIERYDSKKPAAPNSQYCAASYWSRGRAIKVSRSEMWAWKRLASKLI